MAENEVYDVAGYEEITAAIKKLLNDYPALSQGDSIRFSVLNENDGKAMFPVSGGVVVTEKESITGYVTQTCQYPFYVIYRASGLNEINRAKIKEWLDNLGKWLEKQTILVGQTTYTLTDYPVLTGQRHFEKIERSTPAFLNGIETNGAENWSIQLSARYITEFQR